MLADYSLALLLSCCVTALCADCLADVQARAQAAEEALAAANAAAEGEQLALQGQVDESRTVVGQWKEAYEKLHSQYEVIQVRTYVWKGFLPICSQASSCLKSHTVLVGRSLHQATSDAEQGFDLLCSCA